MVFPCFSHIFPIFGAARRGVQVLGPTDGGDDAGRGLFLATAASCEGGEPAKSLGEAAAEMVTAEGKPSENHRKTIGKW